MSETDQPYAWDFGQRDFVRLVGGRLQHARRCGMCNKPIQPGDDFVMSNDLPHPFFGRTGPMAVHRRHVS